MNENVIALISEKSILIVKTSHRKYRYYIESLLFSLFTGRENKIYWN